MDQQYHYLAFDGQKVIARLNLTMDQMREQTDSLCVSGYLTATNVTAERTEITEDADVVRFFADVAPRLVGIIRSYLNIPES